MPTFVSVPLSQEFECPVCCDTMHTVATLMPCLHKLCMADAQRVATCPVCRERVERFAKDHTMTALVADALAAGMVECQGCSAVMGRAASTAHTCTNDLVARLQPLAPHLSQAALRAVIAGWNDVSTTMDDLIDRVLREDQNAVATTAGAAAAAPPTPVAMPRASADGGRLVGTLAFWKPDQRNQFYGFVKLENDDNVFVHSNAVVHGAPSAGVQLSFRVEPSPKDASKRQGYDVVVLQPGEVLGVVVRWPLRDKHKLLYGFVRPYGASPDGGGSEQAGAYFSGGKLAEASFRVGVEAVFSLQPSPVRVGTMQAVDMRPIEGTRDAPERVDDAPAPVDAKPSVGPHQYVERQRHLHDELNAMRTTMPRPSQAPGAIALKAPPPPPQAPHPALRRRSGVLQSWRPDQRQQCYGFAALADGQSVFVHANAVVSGGQPAVGTTVSFRVVENPRNPSQQQARDVVVLKPGECVGHVVRWPLRDKRKMLYGFVGTDSDGGGGTALLRDNAFFAPPLDGATNEDTFHIGSEVVFELRESPAKPGTMQACGVRPIASSSNGNNTASSCTASPLSPVHLLWDFDDADTWTLQNITATYLSILDRLQHKQFLMRHSDVASTVIGTRPLSAAVRRTLSELGVASRVVEGGKDALNDKCNAIEAIAQTVLDTPTLGNSSSNALDDTRQKVVVLVSSDDRFAPMVAGLEENDVRVVLIHDAAPGSDLASCNPSLICHISEFVPKVPSKMSPEPSPTSSAPSPMAPPPPPEATTERLTGTLSGWGWKRDEENELYGYAKINAGPGQHQDSALVRKAAIVYGTPCPNARLSIRVEPHVLQASKLQAFDVVVLKGKEEVGQVLRWPLMDKKERLYGFVRSAGAPGGAYFAGGTLRVSDVEVGCDVVMTLEANPNAAQGVKQAVNLHVLKTRAYPFDAPRTPTPPPPPPPVKPEAWWSLAKPQTIDLSMFGLPDGEPPTPDALLLAESTPGKGRLMAWHDENNLGLIAPDRREFGHVLLRGSAIDVGVPRTGDMVTFKMRVSTMRTRGMEQKQIVADSAMIFNE